MVPLEPGEKGGVFFLRTKDPETKKDIIVITGPRVGTDHPLHYDVYDPETNFFGESSPLPHLTMPASGKGGSIKSPWKLSKLERHILTSPVYDVKQNQHVKVEDNERETIGRILRLYDYANDDLKEKLEFNVIEMFRYVPYENREKHQRKFLDRLLTDLNYHTNKEGEITKSTYEEIGESMRRNYSGWGMQAGRKEWSKNAPQRAYELFNR